MSEVSNVSGDLIWEIVRGNNAYLVKRSSAGGVQFSRDPFNLTNKHSRTHEGFVNDKAVSVQANDKGGVTLVTKKAGKSNTPKTAYNTHAYGKTTSNRKIFKSIADAVGKKSYRGDLNKAAVSRASNLKYSQAPKKETPAKQPRGSKAMKQVA
ncbi:hypothetical protein RBB50_010393 [Rhinocladiella similis]